MRRSIAILLTLMLLTGCADSASSQQESPSQTTTTTETTPQTTSSTSAVTTQTTTTAPATKTNTQTTEMTTNQQESDDTPDEDVIYPTVLSDDGNWRIEYTVDDDDIKAQLDFNTPVDVTKLEYFDSALHWAEALEVEDKEQFIADNYSYIYLSSSFIGSEKADWLYIADYFLCLDGPNYDAYYSKVFYVKDGMITKTIAEFYGACSNSSMYSDICRQGDRLILSVYRDGIYSLDTNTDELTKLCSSEGDWCRIDEMTVDYILFADGDKRTKVYYFDNGEVFKTEMYSGFMDGISFYRDGDTLVFAIYWQDLREKYSGAQYLSLDLQTREYTPLDYEGKLSDLAPKKPAAENEDYIAEADGLEIVVTDKTDGCETRYSLQKLSAELLQGGSYIYEPKLYGDTLFGFIGRSRIFALDLQNNEICVADAKGYFNSYSCELLPDGRIAMSSSGTCAVYGLA